MIYLVAWWLFLWGWVALAAAALIVVLMAARGRSGWFYGIGFVLALFAAGLCFAVRPVLWGVRVLPVRGAQGAGGAADAGDTHAVSVVKRGIHYHLVDRRHAEPKLYKLKSGPGAPAPQDVFWMRDGEAIGVDYGGGEHWIVDVAFLESLEDDPGRRLAGAERAKLEYSRGQLTADEEAEFARSQQAVGPD